VERRDAQANRAKILAVADDVFGRGGETASTEEVAKRAGVGIATVFRHFPTKAALLEAVLVARLSRLREVVEARHDDTDPGAAFYGCFRHIVADAASKIAIGNALMDETDEENPAVLEAARELRRSFGVLLDRAQRADAVRDDIELPECYAVLIGASRAPVDGEVRERSLAIIFDGLRPH
jgi:AcrR family transcriptional regulator